MKVTAWLAALVTLASCGAASGSETTQPEGVSTLEPEAAAACKAGQIRLIVDRPGRCVRLGGAGAAVARSARPGCSETEARRGFVRLGWRPATRRGRSQRVAVTVRRDGFETGRYALGRELSPERKSLVWTRLQGQAIHFWVVLTRTPTGWLASEPSSFEGPTCVADMPG